MVIAGVWAMISPWVLGFSDISIAKWNSLILGLIMVLLNVWIIFGGISADTDTNVENSSGDSEKGRGESKTNHQL